MNSSRHTTTLLGLHTILLLTILVAVVLFVMYVRDTWCRVESTAKQVAGSLYSLLPRLTHSEIIAVSYAPLAPPVSPVFSRGLAAFLARTVVSAYNGNASHDHGLPVGAHVVSKIDKMGYLYAFPAESGRAWVVAFRGSLEGEDFMADIDITQVPFTCPGVVMRTAPKGQQRTNLMVHRGMLSVWQSLSESLNKALRHVPLDEPLYVVGHSLGGALAAFTTMYINSGAYAAARSTPTQSRSLRVTIAVLLGTPRVGNSAFVAALNKWGPYWAIANRCDQLPTLPPTVCGYYSGFYTYADYTSAWYFTRETDSLVGNHTIDTYESSLSLTETYRLQQLVDACNVVYR